MREDGSSSKRTGGAERPASHQRRRNIMYRGTVGPVKLVDHILPSHVVVTGVTLLKRNDMRGQHEVPIGAQAAV